MAGALTAAIAAAFSGVTADPYFEYTTLLLPGSGTNGAQNNTFLDGSTNNFTITRNGNTTQGTFSPFSQTGWGNYFDGSGDYLTLPNNAALAVGSGQFCIEFWIYPTSSWPTDSAIFVSAGTGGLYVGVVGGSFVLRAYAVSNLLTYGTLPTLNTWTHIAICRNSSNVTSMYFNGSRVATGTVTQNFAQFTSYIGNDSSTVYIVQSYLSNLRLIKGSAVYDPTQTTITVPTEPLTAISGTSLLTCQSNRFIDNSTNNFTITRNGDTRVVAFSPFNPTASWSATTNGGSGYFDGNTDYLSTPSNAAFGMDAGDFTYEAWVYVNEIVPSGVSRGLFDGRISGATGCGIYTSASGGYTSKLAYATNSAVVGSSANVIVPYMWTHVAVTRSATTVRGFLNGVLEFTVTDSRTFSSSASTYIGSDSSVNYFNGYIANARIVKGTAVYTAAFTPPTAPLTAITNTSLLLNFTNAGIYDATSKNDLETVGDAQISNAVTPKWGSTSIKFDGTGDYLTSNPATTNMYEFGGGDFTIEMWIRWNSLIGTQVFYDQRPLAGGVYPTLYMSGTTLIYYTNGANRITGSTLSTGQWYHIAVARSGTSTKLFVDGVQSGSTYTDSNVYLNTTLRPFIGGDSTNIGAGINAYMQDVRVTKGYARYTANFTAPTAAFPTL